MTRGREIQRIVTAWQGKVTNECIERREQIVVTHVRVRSGWATVTWDEVQDSINQRIMYNRGT